VPRELLRHIEASGEWPKPREADTDVKRTQLDCSVRGKRFKLRFYASKQDRQIADACLERWFHSGWPPEEPNLIDNLKYLLDVCQEPCKGPQRLPSALSRPTEEAIVAAGHLYSAKEGFRACLRYREKYWYTNYYATMDEALVALIPLHRKLFQLSIASWQAANLHHAFKTL
jgi:hypothetical protein